MTYYADIKEKGLKTSIRSRLRLASDSQNRPLKQVLTLCIIISAAGHRLLSIVFIVSAELPTRAAQQKRRVPKTGFFLCCNTVQQKDLIIYYRRLPIVSAQFAPFTEARYFSDTLEIFTRRAGWNVKLTNPLISALLKLD